MRRVFTLLAAGLVLALPATATAGNRHQGTVPPGNSSIGQYVENVPGAGGNQQTPGSGGGGSGTSGGGSSSSSVPPATQQALQSQGGAGQGAAALAAVTAPRSGKEAIGTGSTGEGTSNGGPGAGTAAGEGTPSTGGGGRAGPADSSSGSGSGLKAVGDQLTGSDAGSGMGIFLPIILGGTLLGALALAVLRWRRGTQQPG